MPYFYQRQLGARGEFAKGTTQLKGKQNKLGHCTNQPIKYSL